MKRKIASTVIQSFYRSTMAAQKEVVRVWLESNKLTEYFQEFIDKGYDDLEEIIQMSDH